MITKDWVGPLGDDPNMYALIHAVDGRVVALVQHNKMSCTLRLTPAEAQNLANWLFDAGTVAYGQWDGDAA